MGEDVSKEMIKEINVQIETSELLLDFHKSLLKALVEIPPPLNLLACASITKAFEAQFKMKVFKIKEKYKEKPKDEKRIKSQKINVPKGSEDYLH